MANPLEPSAIDRVPAPPEPPGADLESDRPRPVVNATGIVLHTGLGRAVLAPCVAASLGTLDRCCNVQIDLETGARGKRNWTTERLLCRLTGAEAALVVNNNAAATFLMLATLCRGKEVIVSRGQLIEIGGSFRLPDCIHESGARLVEVGATNRTSMEDYDRAVGPETGAILRVHASNYRVEGSHHEVPIEDLVRVARRHSIHLFDDIGCGALVDLEAYGLPHEPTPRESLEAGADVACFSADKLIGGPQAGILVGRASVIRRIRTHPLTRLLRVGKVTDVALDRTLRLFLDPETLVRTHPTLRMATADPSRLRALARSIAERVAAVAPRCSVEVRESASAMGGGTLPEVPLPTWVVAVSSADVGPDRLSATLRRHEPPVVARVQDAAVVLDVRTLLEGDDDSIVDAFRSIAREGCGEDRPREGGR